MPRRAASEGQGGEAAGREEQPQQQPLPPGPAGVRALPLSQTRELRGEPEGQRPFGAEAAAAALFAAGRDGEEEPAGQMLQLHAGKNRAGEGGPRSATLPGRASGPGVTWRGGSDAQGVHRGRPPLALSPPHARRQTLHAHASALRGCAELKGQKPPPHSRPGRLQQVIQVEPGEGRPSGRRGEQRRNLPGSPVFESKT